jgi:hypothetical protein
MPTHFDYVGKMMFAVIIGLSGWTLHTIYEHSESLSEVSTQIADLSVSVKYHNEQLDASINKLLEDDRVQAVEIAQASQQIQDLQQRPPVIERQAEVAVGPRLPPPPFPDLGRAVGRLFGLRERGSSGRHGHNGR